MMESDLGRDDFFWILQSICTAHAIPFSPAIAQQQLVAPFSIKSLASAAGMVGMEAKTSRVKLEKLSASRLPLLIWLNKDTAFSSGQGAKQAKKSLASALLLQADGVNALILERDKALPTTLPLSQLSRRYSGFATRIRAKAKPLAEAEESSLSPGRFGFRWFFDEILKYKALWQEIVLASLAIQLGG